MIGDSLVNLSHSLPYRPLVLRDMKTLFRGRKRALELTVFVCLQVVEAVCSQQDVGLSLQRLPKRVTSLGHHVVKHTASREDVDGAGLRQQSGRFRRDDQQVAEQMSVWINGFTKRLTGLSLQSSLSTSGAIQPSVPGTPDLLLKL